jgi:hypothetical protein
MNIDVNEIQSVRTVSEQNQFTKLRIFFTIDERSAERAFCQLWELFDIEKWVKKEGYELVKKEKQQ